VLHYIVRTILESPLKDVNAKMSGTDGFGRFIEVAFEIGFAQPGCRGDREPLSLNVTRWTAK
jgi:hypothetical protein